MNAIKALFQSRKFLLLLADTVVSILLYFFSGVENIEFLIGAMQPVFIALIIAISVEDAAKKLNGGYVGPPRS